MNGIDHTNGDVLLIHGAVHVKVQAANSRASPFLLCRQLANS